MSNSDFVRRYGGIYEHSTWVAECAKAWVGSSNSAAEIAERMANCVDMAGETQQLALIRAHPDLAGKAQLAGELSAESSGEQMRAGLDRCSAEEYALFHSLNARYKEKFGFPFVIAVRHLSRAEILDAFEERLVNDYEAEFETALLEIHKIARLRLQAMAAVV